MADWGAFAQGLAGGIGQGFQMAQAAKMMRLKEQEEAQQAKKRQIESDMKMIDLGFKAMSNDVFPGQMKIQAYNGLRPVLSKYGYDLPEVGDEWDAEFNKVGKAGRKLYEQYTNGEITAEDASKAFVIHLADAQTEKERKSLEPYQKKVEDDLKVQREASKPVSDIGRLDTDKERLSKKYGPDHPIVKAIDNEIGSKGRSSVPKNNYELAYGMLQQQFAKQGIGREPTPTEIAEAKIALDNQGKFLPPELEEQQKRIAAARGEAYQGAKPIAVYNPSDNTTTWKSTKEALKAGSAQAPQSPTAVQATAEARQRGGSMAANVNAANDLYQENLPQVIRLRKVVADKGLLPKTRFKSWNQINQYLQQEFSDPDMVELAGKIKLMADNLQKTIGGGQGGEWAFKVADSLLNSAYDTPAFTRRMMSHGADLAELAHSRRNFGKQPVKTAGPKAGEVQDGYRFKGGNPADKANWEKVR